MVKGAVVIESKSWYIVLFYPDRLSETISIYVVRRKLRNYMFSPTFKFMMFLDHIMHRILRNVFE
jgi:hypothetical protein